MPLQAKPMQQGCCVSEPGLQLVSKAQWFSLHPTQKRQGMEDANQASIYSYLQDAENSAWGGSSELP